MGLLRHIPTSLVESNLPFLHEVDFTQLEAKLAADTLTRPAGDESDPRTRLSRIVDANLRLKDLRMILAAAGANSVWVTGKKGIGKTTLVEALLRARAQRQLTSQLQAKPFYVFDVNDFFVGTGYNELVKDFCSALDIVASQHGLLIIDHIDDFVSMAKSDAGRLINALVSRLDKNGGFQSIIVSEDDKRDLVSGASSGVERRFVQLPLTREPGLDEIKPVLLSHFVRLEEIHGVNFTDEAADEIIRLLKRFPGQAFPGVRPASAIAFADSVAAYVRMNMYAEPAELAMLREKIGSLRDLRTVLNSDGEHSLPALQDCEKKLAETKAIFDAKKQEWQTRFAPLFKAQDSFNLIAQRHRELDIKGNKRTPEENATYDTLTSGLHAAEAQLSVVEKAIYPDAPRVTTRDVQAVFNDRAGVSFESMNEDTITRLSHLETYLNGEIFLQDAAKKALADVYRARELGVNNPSKPAGILFFTGGTALGKTELAEVLARFDAGDNAQLINIRLSEYKGKGAVSRLTGADPGLIGYDNGSPTLEAIETNPRAILLIDEIDKGDPSVYDLFMQIFDKGEIRLASGKLLNFRNAIIVVTSNALTAKDMGPAEMADQKMHQDAIRDRLLAVRSKDTGELLFRPEFLRRIGGFYVFENLGKPQLVDILFKEIRKVNRDYAHKGLSVEIDRSTAETMIDHYNVTTMGGAGPGWIVEQTVRKDLTAYLTQRLTETKGARQQIGDHLHIGFADGKTTLSLSEKPTAPVIAASTAASLATPAVA